MRSPKKQVGEEQPTRDDPRRVPTPLRQIGCEVGGRRIGVGRGSCGAASVPSKDQQAKQKQRKWDRRAKPRDARGKGGVPRDQVLSYAEQQAADERKRHRSDAPSTAAAAATKST